MPILPAAPAAQPIDLRAQQTHYLPPRKHDANKGQFGHVLIIGGDAGMSEAPF
jgi:NAD(P)H-hydrate repair Nnr-like enzyme with NAD(P)H-hydrate dehydratase domain